MQPQEKRKITIQEKHFHVLFYIYNVWSNSVISGWGRIWNCAFKYPQFLFLKLQGRNHPVGWSCVKKPDMSCCKLCPDALRRIAPSRCLSDGRFHCQSVANSNVLVTAALPEVPSPGWPIPDGIFALLHSSGLLLRYLDWGKLYTVNRRQQAYSASVYVYLSRNSIL